MAKYTLAEVGRIINKNPSTLRTHINRGFAPSGNAPKGSHKRFSDVDIRTFREAYKLADIGWRLPVAFAKACASK